MARRRKVGAIKTETVLLIGGAVVLGLFLMNKSSTPTTALPPGTALPGAASSTAAINAQASEQNTIVNDASSNVSNLINSIWS